MSREPGFLHPVVGNLLVGLLLILLALLAMAWQAGSWNVPLPPMQRIGWAALAVFAYLLLTGWLLLRRRAQASTQRLRVEIAAMTGTGLTVVYASQTGFAEATARQTVATLQSAGMQVELVSIQQLDAQRLATLRRVLFVVSTTGEGDAPDMAYAFVAKVMHEAARYPQLQFGMLALGDSAYRNFCGFGKSLERWLRHCGAQPLFDTVDVDNGDAGALRHWQYHLGQLCGRGDLPDWQEPDYARWRLHSRRVLNPRSVGGPCFEVTLKPEEALPDWQAGDIAEIGPQNPPADVSAWLTRHALDGGITVVLHGAREDLRNVLARSTLPAAWAGSDAQGLADGLVRLPHRDYSIASVPADGSIQLVLRQWRLDDGRLGIGTGWLTEYAKPGDEIALRIRANANFHAPSGDVPMLLIGNGTGIASLRGLLKQRIAAGRMRNWLIFGERHRQHDFFYQEEIEAWHARGAIARLDLAFSRDQAERRYVQHCLDDAADDLRTWVAEGAVIFVCGSLAGMAPAVDASLRAILGEDAVQDLIARSRYRRDVY